MYFSTNTTKTTTSPTDIVTGQDNDFDLWWQISECTTGNSLLRFASWSGLHKAEVPLRMKNKLWYVLEDAKTTRYWSKVTCLDNSIICWLMGNAVHDLWHRRLGHPGKYVTDNITATVHDVPSLCTRHLHCHCRL